jgi:hypothetical protein
MKGFLKLMLLVFTVTLGATLALALFYPTVGASRQGAQTATPAGPTSVPTSTPQAPTPTETATPGATPPRLEARLIWERTDGLEGYCDRLTIDGSNRAQGESCHGETWHASLSTDELRQYLTFLARYQPFAYDLVDTADQLDSQAQRISFAGRGTNTPSEDEVREIVAWALGVHARLQEQTRQNQIASAARKLLAAELGIGVDGISLAQLQPTTWRDACLELQEPDRSCALVETPGYLVELSADGRIYRVHASEDGLVKLAAGASPTPVPTASPTRQPAQPPVPTATPTARPVSPPTPWPVTITEWRGEYWRNASLEGPPALVRNDKSVSFDWGHGAPARGLPNDYLSARWSRRVRFGTGTYRFTLRADDGVRLWVAGNLLIDRWHGGYTEDSVLQHIWEGEHEVVVEYFELEGIAKVHLAWQKQEPKPTPTLSPDMWKAEYYERRSPRGEPKTVRNEDVLDFDWGDGSPSKHLRADQFSAQFTRTVTFAPGTYRLHAVADDGVRVWVDDELVIDAWVDQVRTWHQATVALDGEHHLCVQYYENTGGAALSFGWRRIGP